MKRKMLTFSPERSGLLGNLIMECGFTAEKKKMFGHETFFLNGYMFSGANERGIFVNIGKESKEKALENDTDVAPFEPLEGMVMKDYLLLKEPICSDKQRALQWIEKSGKYLLSLPPKKKKPRKKKSAPAPRRDIH